MTLKKYSLLIILFTVHTVFATADKNPQSQQVTEALTCDTTLAHSTNSNPFAFALPAPGTETFNNLASQVKQQFLANQSFAIIDLGDFITEEFGKLWFDSMPKKSGSQITDKYEILQMLDNELVISQAGEKRTHSIKQINEWLTTLILYSLEKKMNPPHTQVRTSQSDEIHLKFENWHIDGGVLNALLAIHGTGVEQLGPSPILKDSREYHNYRGKQWEEMCTNHQRQTLKRAQLVIYLGSAAPRDSTLLKFPYIHRTDPNTIGERVLLVFRY